MIDEDDYQNSYYNLSLKMQMQFSKIASFFKMCLFKKGKCKFCRIKLYLFNILACYLDILIYFIEKNYDYFRTHIVIRIILWRNDVC